MREREQQITRIPAAPRARYSGGSFKKKEQCLAASS
jgi:hypothetical protein